MLKKLDFKHIVIGVITLAVLSWGITWAFLGENPYSALGMEHWFIKTFLGMFIAVCSGAVILFIGLPLVNAIRQKLKK